MHLCCAVNLATCLVQLWRFRAAVVFVFYCRLYAAASAPARNQNSRITVAEQRFVTTIECGNKLPHGVLSSRAAQATGHATMQVKTGDVGNLPLKLFIDMSNNVQPLFREWRARIWSLGFGNRQSDAGQRLQTGPASRLSFDSDDDGSMDARVSADVANAFAHNGGVLKPVPGAPVHMFRDAAGAGVVLRVGVSAPARSAWGAHEQSVGDAQSTANSDASANEGIADLGALHGRVYVNGAHAPAAHSAMASESMRSNGGATRGNARAHSAAASSRSEPVAEGSAHTSPGLSGDDALSSRAGRGSSSGIASLAGRHAFLLDERMLRQLVPTRLTFDSLGLGMLRRR